MTLQREPLLERIREIQEGGETGLLSLGKEGEVITVSFREGLIGAVSTNIPHQQLGQYLARRGYVEDEKIKTLVNEARKHHALIGETAVSKTLLDGSELVELVQEQAAKLLSHALKHQFEIRSFNRSEPPSFYMPARMDHTHLLLEIARNNLQPFKFDPSILISLRNGRHTPPLPWYPQELSVLSELKEPRTIHELAAATGLEYPRLSKILSVFDALQLIICAQSAPSGTTALVRREGFPYESLVPEIRKTGLSEKLETIQDESSFISEQFKTLKVRLSELGMIKGVKVITISSPDTQDGKSLIAINLAASFSKDPGRRVVILDCDLRNPSLHRYLGITSEPGLMGFLEGEFLQAYCYMRRLDKLYFLTAGGVAANPVELLSLEKMRALIAYLKTEFDTIIIDSPPLAPISDTQILTALSDGLVLVVRSGQTTYQSIERGFKTLDHNKLMGVVFNDVKPVMFNTQYNYKYYQYRNRSHYPYALKRPYHPKPKSYLDL